jgi:hypothetical protein
MPCILVRMEKSIRKAVVIDKRKSWKNSTNRTVLSDTPAVKSICKKGPGKLFFAWEMIVQGEEESNLLFREGFEPLDTANMLVHQDAMKENPCQGWDQPKNQQIHTG